MPATPWALPGPGPDGRRPPEPPRWQAFAPGLAQLLRYQRPWLRGDVVAGCTVAGYLIPQVLAYAEVAGLRPVAGLWAATAALAVYAVLGSSPQLSVGPESTTAFMTAAAVTPLAAGDPARFATLAAALALLVGALCLLARLLRLGFVADLLSRPVLIGYMAGVALIMIVSQLGKVTSVRTEPGASPLAQVRFLVGHLAAVNGPTVALAGCVLAALVVGTRYLPRMPVPLVAILGAAGAVVALDLRRHGVAVVGAVPAGVPLPALPLVRGADLADLVLPALGVGVVGYTDNVLTGRAFATRNRYRIDANQEMLALGAANLAAATLHGFPVSSSGSRTVIADSLGARSQLSSLVALATVALTLVAGRGILSGFPVAALGALVIWAASRLVDVGEFRRLARFRLSELLLALATTAGVLVFGILNGVLVAVGLSALDLLRRVARPHDGILGFVPGLAGMHDVDDYPVSRQIPGLVVYRYDSPLFFANAEDFKRRALAAVEDARPAARWLVINAEANVQTDLTALDALAELCAELDHRGVVTALARVKTEVAEDLRRAGLLDRIGPDRVFATLPTAVDAYTRWCAGHDQPGDPPGDRERPADHDQPGDQERHADR